jgi:hypothetical protein
MVQREAEAERRKKGPSAASFPRFLHVHVPSLHHQHRASTMGSMTVEDLLRMARRAKSRERR